MIQPSSQSPIYTQSNDINSSQGLENAQDLTEQQIAINQIAKKQVDELVDFNKKGFLSSLTKLEKRSDCGITPKKIWTTIGSAFFTGLEGLAVGAAIGIKCGAAVGAFAHLPGAAVGAGSGGVIGGAIGFINGFLLGLSGGVVGWSFYIYENEYSEWKKKDIDGRFNAIIINFLEKDSNLKGLIHNGELILYPVTFHDATTGYKSRNFDGERLLKYGEYENELAHEGIKYNNQEKKFQKQNENGIITDIYPLFDFQAFKILDKKIAAFISILETTVDEKDREFIKQGFKSIRDTLENAKQAIDKAEQEKFSRTPEALQYKEQLLRDDAFNRPFNIHIFSYFIGSSIDEASISEEVKQELRHDYDLCHDGRLKGSELIKQLLEIVVRLSIETTTISGLKKSYLTNRYSECRQLETESAIEEMLKILDLLGFMKIRDQILAYVSHA